MEIIERLAILETQVKIWTAEFDKRLRRIEDRLNSNPHYSNRGKIKYSAAGGIAGGTIVAIVEIIRASLAG